MYIVEPNSIIKLYKGIPLDSDYENTLYFASKSAQTSYFHTDNTLVKYTLNNQSYQRYVKGKMRIEYQANLLYDCNYIGYQNTAFGSKWFYAFITNIEYINPSCSEITFEIDVLQTYMFDIILKECIVERMHTESDTIGMNIEPEPVQCGEYVYSEYQELTPTFTDMSVVLAIIDTSGRSYENIYSGARLWCYDSDDESGINSKIAEYTENPDNIIAMYVVPSALVEGIVTDHMIISNAQSPTYTYTLASPSNADDFQGFTPKNKKLYTYPYNYVNVFNSNGDSLPCRYEFFENRIPVFKVEGTFTTPVSVICRPCSYKGIPAHSDLGGYTELASESISLNNYPLCAWSTNYFQTWLAQNGVPSIMKLGASALSSSISPGYALYNVSNTLESLYSASIHADVSHGNGNNGNVNVIHSKHSFYSCRCHITSDYAKSIDSFFTKYGYTVNRIMTPTYNYRPHWNYIKTKDCCVIGKCPNTVIKKITSIFNKGITFWKNASEVGDYNLTNTP